MSVRSEASYRAHAARQAAADLAEAAPRIEARRRAQASQDKDELIQALRGRVAELETWQTRARSCIARLRATRTAERATAAKLVEGWKRQWRQAWDWWQSTKDAHQRASAMIRALLTPAQVQAYRDERDADERDREEMRQRHLGHYEAPAAAQKAAP